MLRLQRPPGAPELPPSPSTTPRPVRAVAEGGGKPQAPEAGPLGRPTGTVTGPDTTLSPGQLGPEINRLNRRAGDEAPGDIISTALSTNGPMPKIHYSRNTKKKRSSTINELVVLHPQIILVVNLSLF